ncbi:RHS repeat-associated core domain-containing protein, partial [Escherichia marmotae]|nr:RHS repeat-associated core domain-containing protein [Escherichia marmotae]
DVNGAPEEMTDSDGKIVWETGYQVWGNTIQEKDHGRVEQNLRYQGQYLDRETGLHYNLHRYYDPDVGRFIVTDPIGLAGGLNLYAYAPNPLGWIDPLGLNNCGIAGSVKWKSFNPNKNPVTGQTGLQYHYAKHGHEFGNITQNQYMAKAKEFASKPLTESMQEAKVGNFVIRHDKNTGEIFVGHMGKREMRTYYIDDGRSKTPFQDAIDLAGEK